MTTRRLRSALLFSVAAVAACTSSSGVVTNEASRTSAPPPPTVPASDPPAPGTAATSAPMAPTVEPTIDALPSLAEPDPAIVVGALDNGLRYLIRENDNPGGSVEMRLVVDAGSGQQGPDQSGVAHFLEHMLFNGTEQFPENELVDVLRSFGAGFGADINAFTSYDETVYELTVPSGDLSVVETGLDVLAQWLTAATLDPAAVEEERGVVLDEWRTSEQTADGRIFDAIEELFLDGSSYDGQDPIGTRDAIAAMTTEPLRRFYDDWYRPDNAAIVVVGDIVAEDVEAGIVDRFAPAEARSAAPPRTDTITPASTPRASAVADPDVAQGFALVNLPQPVDTSRSVEERLQREVLDDLAFSMIRTRLSDAALRGDARFEDATYGSSSIVRSLDAPEIVVDADGAAMEASVQAVLDEFERVRRFGFGEAELARAVAARRSVEETFYAGRETRQDRSFADQYVDHVLVGTPIATADAAHDFVTAVLDTATPGTVGFVFDRRMETSAAHMLVVVPAGEAADVPDAAVFEEMAHAAPDRPLEPLVDEHEVIGTLMATPAPVEERDRSFLSDGEAVSFVRPLVLTFDNGVRVSLNPTQIVDGAVAFAGSSVGGLDAVDLDDVPDADAAAAVVDDSGIGPLDRVALDAFLADKDVGLVSYIDQFTEGFDGFAATSDLEVLFQLVHLRMTEPRVDLLALDRYLDDQLPFALDPSLDPSNAEFTTLLDARYDDPRFLLPTAESLATVDAGGIERVYRDRFGDAGDWAFAMSGDFDVDQAVELARRYLGTLPSSGRVEMTDRVEPPPPPGVVLEQINAGQGDTARLSLLFTAPASANRRDDLAAALIREIVTARLTDSIREELGESYSPSAFVQLTGGASPYAETYLSLTVAPDRVEAVSAAVLDVLAELVSDGPSAAELTAARERVARDLDLYTNQEINAEVLAVLVDPGGNPDFGDYVDGSTLLGSVSDEDVAASLSSWITLDQFIEVRVVPR